MEKSTGNQSDYGRHIGKSRSYVSKLVKQKKIPVEPDGTINFARADYALQRVADPARQTVKPQETEPAEQTNLLSSAAEGISKVSQSAPPASNTYADLKTEKEKYNVELARIDYETRQGNLLPKSEVLEAMEGAARTIAQGLESLVAYSSEIASAGRTGGEEAVRACLKSKIKDIRLLTSESLQKAASLETETDGST
ncbi:hypothetical protein [Kiloniella sp.]|uniref:hypothetical protein n=1 Tax=Kiloniella sp. TaxID=1938587 RepID=UPI003B019C70